MFTDTLLNIGAGRSAVVESAIEPEIDAISIDTVEECVGDPFEFLTGTYYENEMNLTNINQAIMVCEYAYLKETGNEMVYEANVITNMFDNVGKAISIAWEHICAFFKKIYKWLGDTFAADKLWIKTNTKKLEDLKKNHSGIKIKVPFKGYTFSDSENVLSDDPTLIADKAKKMFGQIQASATIAYADIDSDSEDIGKTLNKLRSDLVDSSSGELDPAQFTKELSAFFVGRHSDNIELSIGVKDIEERISYVSSTRATKTSLDSIYNTTKKTINSLLSEVKKCKAASVKSTKETDGKDASKNVAKQYHAKATGISTLTSILTQVNKAAVKAIVTQNRQNKAIAGAAINAANSEIKKSEKKASPKDESATMVDTIFSTILG